MAAARLDFLGLSGNELALQFVDRQRTANHRAGYSHLIEARFCSRSRDGACQGFVGVVSANGSQSSYARAETIHLRV